MTICKITAVFDKHPQKLDRLLGVRIFWQNNAFFQQQLACFSKFYLNLACNKPAAKQAGIFVWRRNGFGVPQSPPNLAKEARNSCKKMYS